MAPATQAAQTNRKETASLGTTDIVFLIGMGVSAVPAVRRSRRHYPFSLGPRNISIRHGYEKEGGNPCYRPPDGAAAS
jgi:hypothetical protein